MYGSATAAIEVSSTSINVASITAAAMNHGFVWGKGGGVDSLAMSESDPYSNCRVIRDAIQYSLLLRRGRAIKMMAAATTVSRCVRVCERRKMKMQRARNKIQISSCEEARNPD